MIVAVILLCRADALACPGATDQELVVRCIASLIPRSNRIATASAGNLQYVHVVSEIRQACCYSQTSWRPWLRSCGASDSYAIVEMAEDG